MMIDSHSPFIFVANNLAIDFVNTCVQKDGVPFELLNSTADFVLWVKQAGFTHKVFESEFDLLEIHQFRQALRALFSAKMDAQLLPAEPLQTLNGYLKDAPMHQQLLQRDCEVVLQPLSDQLSKAQLLGEIAHRASQILISSAKHPIKSCASHSCILMFLDTSKAKKRRWCSMEWCGNRAKAATFYQSAKTS